MQLAYRTVTVAPAFWETNSFPTCSAFAAPQRRVLLLRVFSPAFPSRRNTKVHGNPASVHPDRLPVFARRGCSPRT
ncbi:hypothetical protein CGCVW01_v001735 [Colletotrichum viniferum]|nr:hypothetical protein CGCVW01_v001735 [Colletotrichum viniferum]